jgi:hypothetical protein
MTGDIRIQAQRLAHRVGELPAARVAVARRLGQGPREDPVRCGRQVRSAARQRRRRLRQMRPDHRQLLIALERRLASKHLVRRARQRVLIGPPVHGPALDLFRCRVRGRPQELPGSGQLRRRQRALAQPEIGQVHVIRPVGPRIDEHVRRLHVPVYQPRGVRGVKRRRDRRDDGRHPRRRQRSLSMQQRADITPAYKPHRDEQHAAGLAGLVDRDDVRVVHGRRHPRLADEPLPERLIRSQRRGHDLQRHPAGPAADHARGTPPPCHPRRSAPRAGTPPPWSLRRTRRAGRLCRRGAARSQCIPARPPGRPRVPLSPVSPGDAALRLAHCASSANGPPGVCVTHPACRTRPPIMPTLSRRPFRGRGGLMPNIITKRPAS